ncbi:hypothetical protein C4573_06940 [Candidatus Woesearchaeota archaeon]|nr:MAG: hypothetical protein C4573_06940 [Candidatus Woesearchaeota archaeon]
MNLLKLSRPVFWIVFIVVFTAGFVVGKGTFSVIFLLQLLSFSFPFSLFVFGINDIYDYKTDLLNPRKKNIEGIKLQKKHHKDIKIISLVAGALVLLISFFTFNVQTIILTFLLLMVMYIYSAPPRLKEIPFLDSISNGIMFLLLFSVGYSYGSDSFTLHHSLFFAALIVVAIHAYTTILDYEPDKKANVKTMATVFGKKFTVVVSLAMLLFVLLSGQIQSWIINAYILLCILLMFISLFYMHLVKLFIKALFVFFVIGAACFLIFFL